MIMKKNILVLALVVTSVIGVKAGLNIGFFTGHSG
jgi:hypothetical protein